MWGVLVASSGISILILTLLNHRNAATTKKLDFKNSHMTSGGPRTYISYIAELKKKSFQFKTEEHAGGMPQHAR
jgi:hypothetical protein